MTEDPRPPQWADTALRLLVKPADRDSISGDLLEAYRDEVLPVHGRFRADAWYVLEVAGFAWRSAWVWIVLLTAADIGRTMLDWRVPTHDFATRSTVTTGVAVVLFASAGFGAAWRSRSVRAGALAGILTSAIVGLLSILGSAVLLVIWHDPQTMEAIGGSGGLGEVFTLPPMLMVPATICATIGALAGKGLASLRRSTGG